LQVKRPTVYCYLSGELFAVSGRGKQQQRHCSRRPGKYWRRIHAGTQTSSAYTDPLLRRGATADACQPDWLRCVRQVADCAFSRRPRFVMFDLRWWLRRRQSTSTTCRRLTRTAWPTCHLYNNNNNSNNNCYYYYYYGFLSKPGPLKLGHYTNPNLNPNFNTYVTLFLFRTLFLTLILNLINPILISSPISNSYS